MKDYKKRSIKRILAIFLAFVMVLSPVTVFAAGPGANEGIEITKEELMQQELYALEQLIASYLEKFYAIKAEIEPVVQVNNMGFEGIQPFNAVPVGNWSEIQSALANPLTTVIQLENDIDDIPAGLALIIGAGRNITLTGGYALNGSGQPLGLIIVGGGATLTLDGPIITTNGQSRGVYVGPNATFNMHSGSIQGNAVSTTGGGVFVNGDNGIFNMTGGYIKNNHVTGANAQGGGVHVIGNGAEFNMSGGTIIGNTTANQRWRHGGGGVTIGGTVNNVNVNSSFNMSGDALIYGNHSGSQGGGVAVHRGSIFTVEGGTIENNTARINGGGVAVWGSFYFYEGEIIRNRALGDWDNTPYTLDNPAAYNELNGTGGGVFVGQDMGRFTMRGGLIHGNEALLGGAIGMSSLRYPPHVYIYGGTISYNRAVNHPSDRCPFRAEFGMYVPTGYGGAIYMRGTPRVYINGGLITGNEADRNGGAIAVGALPGNPPGMLTIDGGIISNNEANNGGGIYTALINVYPEPAQFIRIENLIFTDNYARRGVNINSHVARINENVIRPYDVTYYRHAFTNHDMFVPTLREMSIEKYVVDQPNVIRVGDELTYRLVITNETPDHHIYNIIVTDNIPDGLEFVEFLRFYPAEVPQIPNVIIQQPSSHYEDGVLTIDVDALPGGFTLIAEFVLRVTRTGETTNTVVLNYLNELEHEVERRDSETIVVGVPDVTVEKLANVSEAYVGYQIVYTITVTNAGLVAATGVVVTDVLPAEVMFIGTDVETAIPGSTVNLYSPAGLGGTLTVYLGNLAAGGEVTFTVTVLAIAATEEDAPAMNRAIVDGENFGPTLPAEAPVYIIEDLVIPQYPVVTITKEADETNVAVGEDIVYTITVTNEGPGLANNVVVTDVLPAEVTYVSSTSDTPGIDFTYTATGNLTSNIGTLEVDQTIIFTVTVTATAPGEVVNTARVTYDECSEGRYARETVNINDPAAPIAPTLEKTACQTTVVVGYTITYTLTVTNSNYVDLDNFLLRDTLPASLQFVGSVTLNGAPAPATDYDIVGQEFSMLINIPATGEVVVSFQAKVLVAAAGTDIINEAELLGEYERKWKYEYGEYRNVRPVVDECSVTISVDAEEYLEPSVSIDKTASVKTVNAGDTVTYTLVVTNTGDVALAGLTVIDTLPPQLTNPSNLVVPAGSTNYGFTGQILSVTLASLPPGGTATITYTATVAEGTPSGTIVRNTAVVTDRYKEDVSGGGYAIVVVDLAKPTIEKTASPTSVRVGNTVQYTITITNPNNYPLYDFVVVDMLNPNLVSLVPNSVVVSVVYGTNQPVTVTGSVYSNPATGELRVDLERLPANSSTVITFEVTVTARPANGVLSNTAVLYGPTEPRETTRPEVGRGTANVTVTAPGGGGGGTPPGNNIPDPPPTDPRDPNFVVQFSPDHELYLIGYPDGTIRPHGPITRAEVVTIFFRLLDDDYRTQMWSQTNPFRDVILTNWFNNAVSTMANANIVEGYLDGTFRPNQAITRAEFVTIISRFVENPGYTGADIFTDISGHWARGYINIVSYFGWVEGYGDGTFRPNQNITRAEAAAIVNRLLNRQLESVDDLLPGMITWPDNMNRNAWFYLHIQEATNSHYFERKDDGVHERWTELKTPRNWVVLERPDSNPQDILN